MPVWHASIALLRNGKLPKAVAAWTAWEKAQAWNLAASLLNGVGTGQNYSKDGGIAVHLRRRLSEAELALLSQEWLAIPAVDEA